MSAPRRLLASRNKQVWLEFLELSNFKSYAGTHRLGPLKHGLNCIVGPNGSGKSNLMDAICFVLGLDSRHLRGLRINDLAHRREGQPAATANAHVSMQLRIVDSVEGGTGGASTVTLGRRTVDGRSTHFFIDNQAVDKDGYLKFLSTYGILPKVQNCIVSQGQVEALSLRSENEKSLMMDEVSGSGLLREKYESLKEDLKASRSNQSRVAEEVKALATEHRTLRAQWEELKQWHELEEKVKDAEAEIHLFKLFVNEGLGKEAQAQIATLEAQSVQLEASQAATNKALQDADLQRREAKAAKKAVADNAAKLRTDLNTATAKVASLKRKMETLKAARQSEEEVRKRREAELTQTHQEFTQTLSKWMALIDRRTEARASHAKCLKTNAFFCLPEKQREAIVAEKERFKFVTSSLSSELTNLTTQLDLRKRDLTESNRTLSELKGEETKTREMLKQQIEAFEKAGGAKMAPKADECEKLRTEVDQLTVEVRRLRSERDQLTDSIDNARRVLNGFGHYRSEDQRALKFKQTLSLLQKEFPGVFDRVTGLCELTNQRFATAVSTALGLQADSVVVDTFVTAKRALAACKRMRAPPIEFLPLDTIKSRALNSRLRSYGELFTPVMDCISFNQRYTKVFDYLLEDTVVVKDLESARNVAFVEARKLGLLVKVVTLDGQTILKNCNIKLAAPRTGKLDRFAEKQRSEASAVLEGSSEKLNEVEQRLRGAEVKLYGAEGRLADARLQLESYKSELQAKSQTVRRLKEILEEHQQGISRSEVAVVELEQQINALTAARNAKQAEINRAQAGVVKDKQAQKLWEEEQKMRDLVAELESSLKEIEEEGRWCRSKLCECLRQVGVRACDGEMEELADLFQKRYSEAVDDFERAAAAANESTLPIELEKAEAEVAAVTAEMSSFDSRRAEVDLRLQQLEKDAKNKAEEKRLLLHRIHTTAIELEKANDLLQRLDKTGRDLLVDVLAKKVRIPLVTGSLEQLNELLDEGRMTASNVEIDYTALRGKRLPLRNPEAVKAEELKLSEKWEALKEELEARGAQNHKAEEGYEDVKERLKEANKRFQETKRDVERIERELTKTREVRKERYMKCFEHTRRALAEIYTNLTRPPPQDFSHLDDSVATRTLLAKHFSEVHGGSANLELDDPTSDEPFNKGLIFTAMPYGKRYTEMELLSGGEKSMATLALLFSFQAFRPSPFVVLDEVDAALDAANVDALRRFLKQADFQVIIVTLKEEMYCHADAIIGVYKDYEIESSKTVSLDVESYPESVPAA